MSFFPSFLSSIMYQSISMVCNLRTFNSYSFNRSFFINTNHSNSILYMKYIQSVIIPMNYSCKTTVYQSFCTTIENEGIHYKLQFFLQTLVILVAIINSILHATQNNTFHENGNNRIKHCVNQWNDLIVFVWILSVLKQNYVYPMQFALECAQTGPC